MTKRSINNLRRASAANRFNEFPAITPSAAKRTEQIIEAIREAIATIPRGRVASYSQVAAAAGYPRHIRMVPRVLNLHGDGLPWHRVLGAGGAIKILDEAADEQRLRLQAEGVTFRGDRVDLAAHQHEFLT